jgi:hypothetical protein
VTGCRYFHIKGIYFCVPGVALMMCDAACSKVLFCRVRSQKGWGKLTGVIDYGQGERPNRAMRTHSSVSCSTPVKPGTCFRASSIIERRGPCLIIAGSETKFGRVYWAFNYIWQLIIVLMLVFWAVTLRGRECRYHRFGEYVPPKCWCLSVRRYCPEDIFTAVRTKSLKILTRSSGKN